MFWMIPLYILRLLQRFGPQYGYQIKKHIAEALADFTQIKLPTIYYHLAKMAKDGLIVGKDEKTDNRPAKTVYTVTDAGLSAFNTQLEALLNFEYRPDFLTSFNAAYTTDELEILLSQSHLQQVTVEKAFFGLCISGQH
jgi:DNA-binding PadR family transcriptional regulator